MQITRLYLRNYRVYEQELDLPMPAGLVGVFGPNGAGKSALLESILFTLWGRSRTSKDLIRTSGVNGDCITEVEFEHEGHLHLVRRSITGINSTIKAEAYTNNAQVANGVTDVKRYIHSVLGMDDAAFRASVFAEQKQVAAFSDTAPAKRRDLVLRLLGITPLDSARDNARKAAREAVAVVEQVRAVLVDPETLRPEAERLAAEAEVKQAEAASEATAVATAVEALASAVRQFERADGLRQEHDGLVRDGRAVRDELEQAKRELDERSQELLTLDEAARDLEPLAKEAEGLSEAQESLRLVSAATRAEAALAALGPVGDEPEPVDEASVDAAQLAVDAITEALGAAKGALGGAEAELTRAREQLHRSADLSADGDCPLCGQELGNAFDRVRAHRAEEVAGAERRVRELQVHVERITGEAKEAQVRLRAASAAAAAARTAREAWQKANERRAGAIENLAFATADLGRSVEAGEIDVLQQRVAAMQAASRQAERLAGKIESRPRIEEARARAAERLADAEGRREVLLQKVKSLGFDAGQLEAARVARDEAQRLADAARSRAEERRMAALSAAAEAATAAARLADAEKQSAAIVEQTETARHLVRAADLMNAFRTSVVSTVGPALSAQAATLFDELTDHEYDLLRVDPETYEIRIQDAGLEYGMDRFSGSETDLANLALRVAISEHVRFQSGGVVGLLVLDEVFGPLDDDRRERMLLALERLRGRFRQILVVTHANEIKAQLPSAIEVVKLPGRRATAKVVGA